LKRNALLGYKIMLEDLKGRMKSLNILDPDVIKVTVLNKQSGQKKDLHVPRYTSLWKLRNLIGEQFSIESLGFDMLMLAANGREIK
jgi:hypothetical protein